MNTSNYTRSVKSTEANMALFSLLDSTGKSIIDLLSESSFLGEIESYYVELMPILTQGSENLYDVESFSAIIQEYIVYLQNNEEKEEKDRSFRLMIERKPKIDDSFYEKVGLALKNYADKITIKSGNNMMILYCY